MLNETADIILFTPDIERMSTKLIKYSIWHILFAVFFSHQKYF